MRRDCDFAWRAIRGAVMLWLLAACGGPLGGGAGAEPPPLGPTRVAARTANAVPDPARIAQAREVRARHEASLLALPGVVGVGIGLTPDGADVAIQVYLADPVDAALQALPDDLEGVPVVPVVTGSFEAR